tara:strand:- start:2046 stop:2486 length:441 start_codon:yes stop_codon:yes gene_type:complete
MILNTKLRKILFAMFKEQYDIDEKFDYVFEETENGDIYIINRDVDKLDMDALKINTLGLYIGQKKKGEFRPSIEGSTLLGPLAKKNVLEVDKKVAKMWMYGLDIPCKETLYGWVIIKSGKDWLGSGRYKEEGKILNHVPKGRRIHE